VLPGALSTGCLAGRARSAESTIGLLRLSYQLVEELIDIDFDFRHAAFFPKERTGGENSPGARINLNSGVLNPKLLASRFGPEGSELSERGRLRDRIDAVIVHEDTKGLKVVENQGFKAAHTEALIQGPETTRPITEGARNILRAMTEHGKFSE
jgi:hypothetical protein